MSFPQYPKYKTTSVGWVWEIPASWEVLKITRTISGIGSGTTPKSDEQKYYDEGTIPWVNTGDLKDAPVAHVEKNITALALAEHSSLRRYPEGSVVMAMYGATIGKLGILIKPAAVNQACCVFFGGFRVIEKFLFYWLRAFRDQIVGLATGGGQPNVSQDILRMLRVSVPPALEQQQIASFLDRETAKIDALIAEQQRLIELLKEKRQAVISHAVTKGLNPNAPLKPSGIEWLGDIPAHWQEFPLKALFRLKHGYAFDGQNFSDSGEYILMTPGNFHEDGGFREKPSEKFYVGPDILPDFILRPGQLLVAMTEQGPGLLGSALFVPDRCAYLHNQRLGLVQELRLETLSKEFLFHLFNSHRIRAEIANGSTGTKVRHTSPQRILSIKTWLPPLGEQKQIVTCIREKTQFLAELHDEAARAIELLQERRTALISAAVTGQIDVRNLATQEVA